MMNSAATVALGFPTSDSLKDVEDDQLERAREAQALETDRKRNCRFKLETWRGRDV